MTHRPYFFLIFYHGKRQKFNSNREVEFLLISSSQKRYLFAIYELGADENEVRGKDIAYSLGVKRPSVSRMLQYLAEDGLIEKEYYGTVRFTGCGVRVANELYTRYLFLYAFFHEKLHVSQDHARHDAISCLCELSDESMDKVSETILDR
jgi:Mn-dependent DtxR family transcriptional regulator